MPAVPEGRNLHLVRPSADEPSRPLRWLTAIVVIASLAVAVLWWKQGSDRAACQINTRNVQQAVRSHAGMNNLPLGRPLDKNAIVGPGKFIQDEPRCPGGGTYIWSTVQPNIGTLVIECSHPNHQLDPALTKDW